MTQDLHCTFPLYIWTSQYIYYCYQMLFYNDLALFYAHKMCSYFYFNSTISYLKSSKLRKSLCWILINEYSNKNNSIPERPEVHWIHAYKLHKLYSTCTDIYIWKWRYFARLNVFLCSGSLNRKYWTLQSFCWLHKQ